VGPGHLSVGGRRESIGGLSARNGIPQRWRAEKARNSSDLGELEISEPSTLFDVMNPWELEEELHRAEDEIVQKLEAAGPFIRTRIRLVDFLVDQLRFAKAGMVQAERRGLRGLPALEWVEYLSWPECMRRAKTTWRRDLLRRHAFDEQSCLWQAALYAHRPDDEVGVGPPRRLTFPFPLQLGPYPSKRRLTRTAKASLMAHIAFDPEGFDVPAAPLRPVRRLNSQLTWYLVASAAVLRRRQGRFNPVEIVIDEPRDYSATEARQSLLAQVAHQQTTLEAILQAAPSVDPVALAHLRERIDVLRWAAEAIQQAGTRERGWILDHFFTLPNTAWMTVIEALTDGLPPDWLGVFLGFALERKGVLSVRERKRLRKVAAAVLSQWQVVYYPRRELDVQEATNVVKRLIRVRRLLQPKSLFKYVGKLIRRRA
jgi:hypothetical protein